MNPSSDRTRHALPESLQLAIAAAAGIPLESSWDPATGTYTLQTTEPCQMDLEVEPGAVVRVGSLVSFDPTKVKIRIFRRS